MQRVVKVLTGLSALGLLAVLPQMANAQNGTPPSGTVIQDLNGQALPLSGYQMYQTTFQATLASTDITFAFRNDPGYFAFDDASVTDFTTSSATNLLTNGGFETGDITGWNYDNLGASFSGVVNNDTVSTCGAPPATSPTLSAHTGNNEWCDGSTQAYDALDQTIATTVGDTYTVSYFLAYANTAGNPALTNFSQLSTNGDVSDTGGNAADVLVYASAVQSTLPTGSTPEPASMLLMGGGMLGLGLLRLRRKAKQ